MPISGDRIFVGSGAGFSGDRVDAPVAVVDHLAGVDGPAFLVFETLGERTLALAQKARMADPAHGYEPLLEELLQPVLAKCLKHQIRIIGNFGAANPHGAASAIKKLAAEAGCRSPRIAVVTGDDLSSRIHELPTERWEGETGSGQIDHQRLVAANAYLGAGGIVEGLNAGADIIVTGRVSDPALVLGPIRHSFGWEADDWQKNGAGIVAGHLLECGSQVTGGYFADPGFKDVPGLSEIGYPIGECHRDGSIIIGKPLGSGGIVSEQTVKEQLLYEIHDPARYLTPDGVADFSSVAVEPLIDGRVRVSGATGHPATDSYKVTVSLRGGWLGEGEISYAGANAEARARIAGQTLLERLDLRSLGHLRRRVDLIGVVSVLGDDEGDLRDRHIGSAEDVRLRLAIEGDSKADVEAATQEVLALLCAGPAGGGGARRRHVERIHTVSCLVPKAEVPTRVEYV